MPSKTRLEKAKKAYKKYHEVCKVIAAIGGVIAGISGCGVFAHQYGNYHAAVWSAFSVVCALIFLRIVFSVRRDVERKIKPEMFTIYMVIGGIGMLVGLVVLITYAAIGINNHEEVGDPNGKYVSAVWGFFSLKWSLFAVLSARTNRKKYLGLDGEMQSVVNS